MKFLHICVFNVVATSGPSVPPKSKKDSSNSNQQDGNRVVAGRFTVTKASLPAGSPATASMSAVSVGAHGSSAAGHQQPPPQQGATPFMPFGHTPPSKQVHHQHQHNHAGQHQPHSLPPTTVRLPHHPSDMEYVQIDTSYQPAAHAQQQLANRLLPITMTGFPDHASAKKGVLSQLIDKVRSKDDRKKSSASGVSSSSSGGTTIPQQAQPSQVPPATTVMGRRALSMYDAQCQYGTLAPLDSATSAVAALALANSSVSSGIGNRQHREAAATEPTCSNNHNSQRRESRPMYSRAKSFVKSKSDDERPPSKLSKESRARSAGQLETDLLRSLSTSSKDASRLLSLYQGYIERESQQLRQQQQQHHQMQSRQAAAVALQIQQQQAQLLHHQQQSQRHQHSQTTQLITHSLHYPLQQHHFGMSSGNGDSDKRGNIAGSLSEMPPIPKLPTAAQQLFLSQQQQQQLQQQPTQQQHHRAPPPIPQQHHQPLRNHVHSSRPPPQTPDSTKFRGRNGHQDEDDDYQFLPMSKVIPVSRSQSAPPRKPPPAIPGTSSAGSTSTQQVRVYVHEEPRSTRSSPSATLSKSLEDSYLYGFITQQHGGGLTPSSSGGQSGYGSADRGRGQSAFTPLTKKPTSMESLVSLSTEQNSTGHSRKSSIDFDRRSVVTVRQAGSKSALITRQHSWEAGTSAQFSAAPGKREQSISTPQLSPDDPFGSGSGSSSRHSSAIVRSGSTSGILTRSSGMFYDDEQELAVGNTLHKADSFEGHEEAVRSIVAAVQETRSLQRKLQSS